VIGARTTYTPGQPGQQLGQPALGGHHEPAIIALRPVGSFRRSEAGRSMSESIAGAARPFAFRIQTPICRIGGGGVTELQGGVVNHTDMLAASAEPVV